MSTKLTYTGAEVQELLDKIGKGDFDNAKTLEGHPASYFAVASELTSLAESFATEQGRINTLCSYFNNGSANDALSLGGQLPSYYATATQYEILQQTLADFKSLFDSMFEKDPEGNIHAKLSLWSSGGITAGGVGSGGSGGGGGESYNRLDSWADYSADKSGWVLSALLGKDLDNRVSALANAGYITQSALAPYALRSEIPSLVGYATEAWVASQGYITQSALSPYFLISSFTKANIKSTLGISDWALASVKPSYAWSEIVSRPTKLSDFTDDVVAGKYLPLSGGQMVGELAIKGGAGKVATIRFMPNDGAINHWLGVNTIGELWFTNNGWYQQWVILHAGNYSDYALSVNGGTVNGSVYMNGWFLVGNSQPIAVADTDGVYQTALYLSAGNNFSIGYGTSVVGKRRTLLFGNIIEFKSNGGEDNTLVLNADRTATFSSTVSAPSFIGNLTGTADKASTQAVPYSNRDVNLWDIGNRTARYFALGDTAQNIPSGVYALGSILMEYLWDTNAGFQMISSNAVNTLLYRSRWNGAFKDWREIAFTDSNVASATKLATARNIFGQSFDGTKSITGNEKSIGLDSVNAINNDPNSWVYKYSLKLESSNNAMTFMVDNTENSRKAMIQVGHLAPAYAQYLGNLYLNPLGGNVAIGGKTADEKLHVHGNGKFTGALTANSFIGGTSTISGDLKGLQNLIFADGSLGRKFSLTNGGGIYFQAPSGSEWWSTSWTVKSNDGITSFGDLAGALGVGDSFRYFYFGGQYDTPSIAIMPSGMVAIGGTTADEKLHVYGDGKFTGALTAPAITANSLTIGGVTLTYDSVNEALCINGNMYALGGITAGGAGISAYTSLEARVARIEQQLNIS